MMTDLNEVEVLEVETTFECNSTLSVRTDSGMSAIKAEFIDNHYKPRLVTTYLPEDTVEEIQNLILLREKAEGDRKGLEPPSKKSKLKGRNRKRPMEKRPAAAEKLCPNIVGQRVCSFGDRCKFSHDIAKFMESRPKPIEGKCYVFETYGKCPFGVTCLFSDQHVNDNLDSAKNQELDEKFKNGHRHVKNVVSKDLQIRLRKKEYNFKRANKVIRQFQEKSKDKDKTLKHKDSILISSTSEDQSKSNSKTEKSSPCANIAEASFAELETIEESSQSEIQRFDPLQRKLDDSINTAVKEQQGDCKVPKSEAKEAPVTDEGPTVPPNRFGCVNDGDISKERSREKKKIDFSNKLYLAPLTTVGNLPFRRLCKRLGADVTCGEMAMSSNLLQGQASEWALLKRHESETLFGAQLCGSYPDTMTRTTQVISDTMEVDFIDVNLGCPIDLVVQKGEGCAVMGRIGRLEQIVYGMSTIMDVPLTVKMRTGLQEDKHTAHVLLPKLRDWGVSMVTVHGRSREQRYTKVADWNYIKTCVDVAKPMDVFGNGDILSFVDYNNAMELSGAAGCMIARGALIKPWLFTEIKEQRHWDISASERLEIVREYVNYGLEHWGSDQQGVANTRRFLLEWLSFFYRYIPVGILERVPQRINEKPPHYFGRSDLETLMASPNCADWIKISEMFLGPVPDGFTFLPKHRANAYQ